MCVPYECCRLWIMFTPVYHCHLCFLHFFFKILVWCFWADGPNPNPTLSSIVFCNIFQLLCGFSFCWSIIIVFVVTFSLLVFVFFSEHPEFHLFISPCEQFYIAWIIHIGFMSEKILIADLNSRHFYKSRDPQLNIISSIMAPFN